MTRMHFGVWTWTSTCKDKAFEKRLKWIGNCASIYVGTLHCQTYFKANTTRFFFETKTIWVPKKLMGEWVMLPLHLDRHTCYYLGTYPNYWNTDNNVIVFANDLMTWNAFPMENTPVIPSYFKKELSAEQMMGKMLRGEGATEFIPDYVRNEMKSIEAQFGKENLNDYLYPDRIPTDAERLKSEEWQKNQKEIKGVVEDLTIFYDKTDLDNYLKQDQALGLMHKIFRDCIKRKYPTPTRAYTPKQKTPIEPPSATAVPMEEIKMPTPSTGPHVPPKLTINLSFGWKIIGQGAEYPGNALEIKLTIEEVLF